MNFQAVRQIKGQMDGNFPAKVDMIGVFAEIGGVAYTTNQKPFCDCQITDLVSEGHPSEKHKVRLYVKEAIPLGLLNTECSFSISAYDGTFTDSKTGQQKVYVGYSGFWNDKVLQRPAQQGQVTPYQPPQRPQQPPQQANMAQGIQSTVDRLRAIEIASGLIAAGKHETVELYALADFIMDYIQTGKHPSGVAGANPQDPDFPNDPRQD